MTKIEYVLPEKIEERSFEIIENELLQKKIAIDEEKKHIVKRVIHTTADFDYAKSLCFSENAVKTAEKLILEGAFIVTDTNMAKSGINKKILADFGGEVFCFMADDEVAKEAKERHLTRAYVSMEKAIKMKKKVIFAIGNAPTALIALYEIMKNEGLKPDFVIGVPVGFVNVEAAKELFLESDVPFIINKGQKGGSTVAAAICNAILYKLKSEKQK